MHFSYKFSNELVNKSFKIKFHWISKTIFQRLNITDKFYYIKNIYKINPELIQKCLLTLCAISGKPSKL